MLGRKALGLLGTALWWCVGFLAFVGWIVLVSAAGMVCMYGWGWWGP